MKKLFYIFSLYIFDKKLSPKIFHTYLEIPCMLHLFINVHFICYFTCYFIQLVSIPPTILKRRSLSCCLIDIVSAV